MERHGVLARLAAVAVATVVLSFATAQGPKPKNQTPASKKAPTADSKNGASWLKRMAAPAQKSKPQAKRSKSSKPRPIPPLSPLPRALPGQIPESGWNPNGIAVRQDAGPLIMTRLEVQDSVLALRSLQVLGGQLGGSVARFDEAAKSPDPEGVVLVIPSGKIPEAEKRMGELGSVIISTRTNGTNSERLAKVEEGAKRRLAELEELRDKLLVHYMPGANPVQDALESLGRVQRSLTDLHRLPLKEGFAVVWVRFI